MPRRYELTEEERAALARAFERDPCASAFLSLEFGLRAAEKGRPERERRRLRAYRDFCIADMERSLREGG